MPRYSLHKSYLAVLIWSLAGLAAAALVVLPDLPSNGVVAQSVGITIKQRNPVVNEGSRITLTALDINGQAASGVRWESGSPDIASVDSVTGVVTGMKQGFATITVFRGNESFSVFVVVARVTKGKGEKVNGDTKVDSNGRIYITNPSQHVILRAEKALSSSLEIFAGQRKTPGRQNGAIDQALFAGPTSIAVDQSAQGGIYVADTLNHSIRKIGFNNRVETVVGNGQPGLTQFDERSRVAFGSTQLRGPRGIAADRGGNIFVSDTENHAIYYIDFTRQQVMLLAGQPGASGAADGPGLQAKFQRPSGMALSTDGRLLTVADEENNRVRLLELGKNSAGDITAQVSTLGTASSAQGAVMAAARLFDREADELVFNRPQAVSFDAAGNIYVVDQSGVNVVTRPNGALPQIVPLAQPEISFNQAVSVVVRGTESFVLDANASDEAESLAVVTVGAPEIESVTPNVISGITGGEVIVRGKNFAPESIVTFGDDVIRDTRIVSATEIRLRLGPQTLPGVRTLSVLTRGGLAQSNVNTLSKPQRDLLRGEITTISGGKAFLGDGGRAINGSLTSPTGLVVDGAGNLFIADFGQGVRMVSADTGIITTVVGGGSSLADGVPATVALSNPRALAIDRAGNLFIAEAFTRTIRRVDALTNTITTIAGAPEREFSGDGGAAKDAGFGDEIADLRLDANGNIFVLADGRIRRIDAATGIINTVAGNPERPERGDNIPATRADLTAVGALALDSAGNIFVGDIVDRSVRRIDAATGLINTLITRARFPNAPLFGPDDIDVDAQGNILVIGGGLARFDLRSGQLQTINASEVPDNRLFFGRVTVDGTGNLFVALPRAFINLDGVMSRRRASILRIEAATGNSTVVVGGTFANFRGDDGSAELASLGVANDVAIDRAGNIFVADRENGLIRRIDAATGIITTIAGKNAPQSRTQVIDNIPANDAFIIPEALAVTANGDLLIADGGTGRVRRINSAGIITTVAGNGKPKSNGDGKPATKAGLGALLLDIAVDARDNIFIATDKGVRRVDGRTGIISTVVSRGFDGMSRGFIINLATDRAGNLFFTDSDSSLYRRDVETGDITLLQRKSAFQNMFVRAIAVSPSDEIFVSAVRETSRIFRVDAGNRVSLVAGGDGKNYLGDGGPAVNAVLPGLAAVTFDRDGNLLLLNANGINTVALRVIRLN